MPGKLSKMLFGDIRTLFSIEQIQCVVFDEHNEYDNKEMIESGVYDTYIVDYIEPVIDECWTSGQAVRLCVAVKIYLKR